MQNHFGEWSDPSLKTLFDITYTKPKPFVIDSAFIGKSKKGSALHELYPDTWYWINIHLTSIKDWHDFAFLLANIRNSGYTLGNPSNKWGEFLPAANYIFNVEFDSSRKGLVFHEKRENKELSETLSGNNAIGIYTDAAKSNMVMDSTSGWLHIKMKLQSSAKSGSWQLSVCAFNWKEDITNIFRTRIDVKPKPSYSQKVSVIIICFIVVFIIIVLAFYKNLKKGKGVQEHIDHDMTPEKARITEYLRLHLKEEVSVEHLRVSLGLSHKRYYEFIKKSRIESLPKYLNQLRIERAQELLKDPKLNISEISFEVGYADPWYFSKNFKQFTGQTPREYRKKSGW